MMLRRSLSAHRYFSSRSDVTIIGGGPVGNALACSLGQSSWSKHLKVVVLEAGSPKRLGTPPPVYSNRVFACNPASVRMFKVAIQVGADGFRSGVRKAMGVKTTSFDYDQMAIVCSLAVETESPNDIAWQRFTPLGPIALLPLTDNLCSLVWTSKTSDAKRLLSLSPENFVDELNHYLNQLTNGILGAIDSFTSRFSPASESRTPPKVVKLFADTRAAFPLGFSNSHSYVKTRAALVGDAAHRVHPLAGQGVNLGWSDVVNLTKALQKAAEQGADLGSLTYLSSYDSTSQKHNIPVMTSVDWLNRLYRTSFTPLVLLRSLGLYTIEKLPPLKDFIVNQASH